MNKFTTSSIALRILYALAMLIAAVIAGIQFADAATTAPATPALQFVIRNFTTGQDTTIAITDGSTIAAGSLPAKATIEAKSSTSIAKAEFVFDQLPVVQQWSTPFLVGNKYAAMNLGVGPHTLTYATASNDSANFGALTTLHFTITSGSTTQATNTNQVAINATWGANYPLAADNPAVDPTLHPQLVTAQKALNQPWVRVWIEYATLVRTGDSYWTICRRWRSLGFKVLGQYQGYQDSTPKFSMPARATYLDAANRFANCKALDAVSWGNEIDSTSGQVYYIGTLAQMNAMLADVALITHAAGILNIAPSFVHSESWLNTAKAAGLYAHMDAADGHFYNDPVTDLAQVKTLAAFCVANNLRCFVTEFGFNNSDLAQHASQMQTLLSGMANITGTFMPWSQLPNGTAAMPSPISAGYVVSQSEYAAWLNGMTTAAADP